MSFPEIGTMKESGLPGLLKRFCARKYCQVFILFVGLAAVFWGLIPRGWASTHGIPFCIGIAAVLTLSFLEKTTRLDAQRMLIASVVFLAIFPVFEMMALILEMISAFELRNGGIIMSIGVFWGLMIISVYLGLKSLSIERRLGALMNIALIVYLIYIWVGNRMMASSYTGFWYAEIH